MPDILNTPSNNISVDFDSLFTDKQTLDESTISTPSVALIYSMNNLGKVDMDYMCKLTGLTPSVVASQLKGYIYLESVYSR